MGETTGSGEPADERVAVQASNPERNFPAPWIVDAFIQLGLVSHRLPVAGRTFGIGARLGPNRLAALEIVYAWMPSQLHAVGGGAVGYSLHEGGIAYAPSIELRRSVDLVGLAGMRFGAMRTGGAGFVADREVERLLADVVIGARAVVTFPKPCFLMLHATAFVPLLRQTTHVNDGAAVIAVDRRSVVGAEVGLGFGIHFSP